MTDDEIERERIMGELRLRLDAAGVPPEDADRVLQHFLRVITAAFVTVLVKRCLEKHEIRNADDARRFLREHGGGGQLSQN